MPTVITQIFKLFAELVLPRGISTKEEKTEMETHPVTVEKKISKYSMKFKLLYASYPSIHFGFLFQ